MGIRASDTIAHRDAASGFGLKFRIEVVAGDSVENTNSWIQLGN